MAELAVIMAMISVTSTATSLLALIKRRCGASQATAVLVTNCDELVAKIHELLKTLEGESQVPYDTRRISTALNQRRQEFDKVLKKLERMNRRIERTKRRDRTERFIMAQGWAKKMEAIHSELVQLRSGIENIASSWDAAKFVAAKIEEMVTIDVTRKKELRSRESYIGGERMRSGTVISVDRSVMTMISLSEASRNALSQCGRLDLFSLPEALYTASTWAPVIGEVCYLELLRNSVDLLHPQANWLLGMEYKSGGRLEKNLDLALTHFRVASERGEESSTMELIAHYAQENDWRNVMKYVEIAIRGGLQWEDSIRCDRYPMGHEFETGELEQYLIRASTPFSALMESMCYFIGVGSPQSRQKAADALPTFDSGSYTVSFDADNSNCFSIRPDCYRMIYKNSTWRSYLDFLFESNQYLLFLTLSYGNELYSSREWKQCALHAANNNSADAHFFLAEYYSSYDHRNSRKMQQHLRIAADDGHSKARTVCRRMFGRNENLSREVRLIEERRGGNLRKEGHGPSTKKSKSNRRESRKKRKTRASKKGDVERK